MAGTRKNSEELQVPQNPLEIRDHLARSAKVGCISEEYSCVLNYQEPDVASEYLTFALSYLCKAGQDHKVKNISQVVHTQAESSVYNIQNSAMDKEGDQNIKILESLDETSVKHNDVLSDNLKSQCSDENTHEENDNERTLSFSQNRIHSALSKESICDIYNKVFKIIQSGVPSDSKREHNDMLYTISCDSDVKLSLLLPNELLPHMVSIHGREENCIEKQCKQRKEKKISQKHALSNVKAPKPRDSSKQDKLKLKVEQSNSVSLNYKYAHKTRIIQTRSGRKTRFTYFSQTSNDDGDDDNGNYSDRSELQDGGASSLTKQIKVSHNSAPSKRKRSQKTSHENLALDCAETNTDIPEVQNCQSQHSSLVPKKIYCSDYSMMNSLRDPVLSLIENHHTIKSAQENELLNLIKDHKKEHTKILKEICCVLEDLNHYH